MQPVPGPCGPAVIMAAGIFKGTVEIDGFYTDVAYYLTLVGQVGVFTFAIQVAVIRCCIRRFFYRIHRLLENIIYKFIAGKMKLAETDTILTAQILPV